MEIKLCLYILHRIQMYSCVIIWATPICEHTLQLHQRNFINCFVECIVSKIGFILWYENFIARVVYELLP